MERKRGRSAARSGSLAEQGRQGLASHQLHGEERPAAEAADVVNRHDARMLQLAADLRFLKEPPRHVRAAGVLLEQHLDREVSAQVDVSAAKDRPHAATGDLTR